MKVLYFFYLNKEGTGVKCGSFRMGVTMCRNLWIKCQAAGLVSRRLRLRKGGTEKKQGRSGPGRPQGQVQK